MVPGLGQTPGPCAGAGVPATPRAGGQVRQVTCAPPWCPALHPGVEQQGLLRFQAWLVGRHTHPRLPGDGGHVSQSRRQLPAGRGGGRGCSWDRRTGCAANGTRRGRLSLVAGPGWPTSAGEGGQGPGRAHGSWASGAGGPLHQATGSLRAGASCPPSASAPPPPSLPGAPTSSLGSDPEEPVAVGLREAKSSSSTGTQGWVEAPLPQGPEEAPPTICLNRPSRHPAI